MSGRRSVMLCCGFLLLALAIYPCEAANKGKGCGKNAVYLSCGPSCETRCATLGDECLIRHIRCPDGCYCEEGYARDAKNKCIPIAQCPPKGY